jgi:hypothetical protein
MKNADASEKPIVNAAIAQIGTWLQEFVPVVTTPTSLPSGTSTTGQSTTTHLTTSSETTSEAIS